MEILFTMSKNEKVLVVPSDRVRESSNIRALIDVHGILVPRGRAEKDARLRQVIPYIACQLPLADREQGERFWLYKRRTGEPKLKAKYSVGVGGHLNSFDYNRETARELYEETGSIVCSDAFVALGLILKDDDVGKYHVGVVHRIWIEESGWSPSRETSDGRWASKEEIGKVRDQLESWSRILLDVYL